MSTKKQRREANAAKSRAIQSQRNQQARAEKERLEAYQLYEVAEKARGFAKGYMFLLMEDGPKNPKLLVLEAEWLTFKDSLQPREKLTAILAYRAEIKSWGDVG